MQQEQTYQGKLIESYNGEEDDILFLEGYEYPLADHIQEDIQAYGHYLSVRYYISEEPITDEEMAQVAWLNQLEGVGDAKYHIVYSDITGYLWTDEWLLVGGHDLLGELRTYLGKNLLLIIGYSEMERSPLSERQPQNYV